MYTGVSCQTRKNNGAISLNLYKRANALSIFSGITVVICIEYSLESTLYPHLKYYVVLVRFIIAQIFVLNPLSASCSCDVSNVWVAHPSQPICIHHPPIRAHPLPQSISHWCISPRISQIKLTLSVLKI